MPSYDYSLTVGGAEQWSRVRRGSLRMVEAEGSQVDTLQFELEDRSGWKALPGQLRGVRLLAAYEDTVDGVDAVNAPVAGTAAGGVILLPGVFGNAVQATTNLVTNPSFEAALTELVANGSFEVNTTGWNGVGSTVTRTSAKAKLGSYSALVEKTGATENYVGARTDQVAITNRDYTATAWVQNDDVTGMTMAQIRFYWEGGANAAAYNTSGEGIVSASLPAGQWTQLALTAKPDYADRTTVRVFVVLGAPSVAAGQGFYLDDVHLYALPTGWSLQNDGGAGRGVLDIVSDAYSGAKAMRLTKTNLAAAYVYAFAPSWITVTAETAYTLSLRYKVITAGSDRFRIAYGDDKGSLSGTQYLDAGPHTEWQTYVATFTTNVAASLFYMLISSYSTTGGSIVFDAIQLEAGASATPYCDGSLGAGHSWAGTAHASASSRTAASLYYANPLSATAGAAALWWVPAMDQTGPNRYLFHEGNLRASFQATDDKIYFGDGTNLIATAALTFAAGVKQHLAFTWGAAGLAVYRNGVLAASGATYTAPALGASLYVGSTTAGASPADGLIDDLVIVDYQMGADEVAAVYAMGSPINAQSGWQEVVWSADGARLFGGYTAKTKPSLAPGGDSCVWEVRCESYHALLDRTPIVRKTYANQTVGAIAADLFATAGLTGFDTTTHVAAGSTLALFTSDGERLSAVLDRLVQAAGDAAGTVWTWRVDADRALWFGAMASDPASFSIAPIESADWSASYPPKDIDRDEDDTTLINRVTVRGGVKASAVQTDKFDGDASTVLFTLSHKPVRDIVRVTVGGTLKSHGTDWYDSFGGGFDCLINYAAGTVRYPDASPPAAGSENVVVSYRYDVAVTATATDAASYTRFGRYFDHEEVRPDITADSDATALASAILNEYAQPVVYGDVVVERLGIHAGQRLQIEYPLLDLSGYYPVRQVSTELDPAGDGAVCTVRYGGRYEKLSRAISKTSAGKSGAYSQPTVPAQQGEIGVMRVNDRIEVIDRATTFTSMSDYGSATGIVLGYDTSTRAGKLLGLSGGTLQAYFDSDGKIKAGAGAVVLSSTGISATAGTIGGWTLGASTLSGGDASLSASGKLTLGTGNAVVVLDATDANNRIWAGDTTASNAPFRVSKVGALLATLATITGKVTSGSGNNVVILDPANGLQVGHATFASAPFRVTLAGEVYASSVKSLTASATSDAAIITGDATGGGGSSIGVYGKATSSGTGVKAEGGTFGVYATGATQGVYGYSSSGTGINGVGTTGVRAQGATTSLLLVGAPMDANSQNINNINYAYTARTYVGDTSHYLYLSGNDIYWYNGTTGAKLN